MRVDTCRDPPNEPVSSRFEMDFGSILDRGLVSIVGHLALNFNPPFTLQSTEY